MTAHPPVPDPTEPLPVAGGGGEPLPVAGGGGEPLPVAGGAGEPLPVAGDDIHPEDPDDDWSSGTAPTGVRVRRLTGVLVLLIAVAAGFWGGALAEKHHGTSTTSSALASRLAALRTGRGGAAGAGTGGAVAAGSGLGAGAGGGASGAGAGRVAGGAPATSGLVTEVQGPIVYVTNASGSLVKVSVGPSTTVTRSSTGTAGPLAVGDSIVVRGTRSPDGSVAAAAITATAAGVPAGG